MKLEIKIEDGKPIIVFTEEIERNKTIAIFSQIDGHCTAQRSYLRSLKKPESAQELREAWQLLKNYSAHVLNTALK